MSRNLSPRKLVMLMPFREKAGIPGHTVPNKEQYGIGRIGKRVVLVCRTYTGESWDYGYSHDFNPDDFDLAKGFVGIAKGFRGWLHLEPDSVFY